MVAATLDLDTARAVIGAVVDPEIPVLTISDLGILRRVALEGDRLEVTITPTYSGCPAMAQISDHIVLAARSVGFEEIEVRVSQSPPWSTDWIGPEARRALTEFGIAPPSEIGDVMCPQCAGQGEVVSWFGSTACKALMVCSHCGEPFDHFKGH